MVSVPVGEAATHEDEDEISGSFGFEVLIVVVEEDAATFLELESDPFGGESTVGDLASPMSWAFPYVNCSHSKARTIDF